MNDSGVRFMPPRYERTSRNAEPRGIVGALVGAVGLAVACGAIAAEGTASGTVTYRAKSGVVTATPKHAYLVKGPDAVDQSRIIRRLVFSTSNLGAKIGACKTMSCPDAELGEGVTLGLTSTAATSSSKPRHCGTMRVPSMSSGQRN